MAKDRRARLQDASGRKNVKKSQQQQAIVNPAKESKDKPGTITIHYGGNVTILDFVIFPAFGAISALALIPVIPTWLAGIFILAGLLGAILLLAVASIGVFNEYAWIEGSRIQFPLMLGSFVIGEMLFYASIYYRLSLTWPKSFSQTLTPASSVYFSVTAWTTTGFGDIHPQYAAAMLLVASELIIAVSTVIAVLSTAASKAFAYQEKK